MTLEELNAEAAVKDGEVVDPLEEEVDDDVEPDTSLEENLQEACETIDKLLAMMEGIVITPRGRVVHRLPRHFQDVMEEASEFLEELDYAREEDNEEAA